MTNFGGNTPHNQSDGLHNPVGWSGVITDDDREAGKGMAAIYALFEVCHDLNIAITEFTEDEIVLDAPAELHNAVMHLAKQRYELMDKEMFAQLAHVMEAGAPT